MCQTAFNNLTYSFDHFANGDLLYKEQCFSGDHALFETG